MKCRKCLEEKPLLEFPKGRRACKACTNARVVGWKRDQGRAYRSWSAMKDRCGRAKGYLDISVCPEWDSFDVFLKDMGMPPTEQHTIDRIDSGENYHPENCRWATRMEQQANIRTNKMIEVNGETLHLSEWARRFGISPQAIWQRINSMGWSPEKAVTTPIRGAACP